MSGRDDIPHANRPQCQFLAMTNKNRAFVGGYGSGKTWVGGMAQCVFALEHPRINQGYFAPTYPQIRDIYYPTIDEVCAVFGMRADIKTSNKEIHLFLGRQYRSTIICRSMDTPSKIVGFKIGNALVDELDVMPPHKAQEAWRKILARMRYKDASIRNGIDVTTTPEGFRETHRLFVQEVADKPHLAANYGLIQASTYDNEANIPADYIPSLEETYTKELVSAYVNGQFVNMTSGTVYRNYDRKRNRSTEMIKPQEPLFIGMDFNVTKMAATIYVQRPNGWHAVAELKDMLDTPDMISALKERYQVGYGDGYHHIAVYPDASGDSRKTVDASKSDIALLSQAGFEVRVNYANPAVKDRINATNKRFEIRRLWVNDRTCPTVVRCLEGQVYDDNGEPDKKAGFDHQNDATSYPIIYEHPIDDNHIRKVSVGGH